mgnify:CR=1 FL=1
MKSNPIFIVGVQRSGTTLLSAMLAAHSRMSCGPETHFFQRLEAENIAELIDPENWPKNAKKFISSISFTNYISNNPPRISILEKYHLTEYQIEEYLNKQRPAIDSLLCSVVEPYMQSLGKSRWVEKTPDHIQYLDKIRKYFPDSPIIRIIRDPRDVSLSLMKVPWGAKTYYEAICYWKFLDDISYKFFDVDQNSYTLRYEDLLENPERELRKLCSFLDEDYEEGMLNTSTTGKLVNSQNVPWKKKAEQPIDKNRAGGWRNQISTEMNQFTEGLIGDKLIRYGYPMIENFPHFGEYYPQKSPLHFYETKISKIAAEGIRFWKITSNEKPIATVLLGDPMKLKNKEDKTLNQIRNIWNLFSDVIQAVMMRKRLYWITISDDQRFNGLGSKFLNILLKPFKVH